MPSFTARAVADAIARNSTRGETRDERIARQGMSTSLRAFEYAGAPWVTARDWQIMEQDARNPNQNTRIRNQAAAMVEPASVYPRLAEPKKRTLCEKRPKSRPERRKTAVLREVVNIRSRRKNQCNISEPSICNDKNTLKALLRSYYRAAQSGNQDRSRVLYQHIAIVVARLKKQR